MDHASVSSPRALPYAEIPTHVSALALTLLVFGGLNWGLIGFFGIDVVALLFGTVPAIARVIYGLFGVAAVATVLLMPRLLRLR